MLRLYPHEFLKIVSKILYEIDKSYSSINTAVRFVDIL